jgi:hypothetical protein
MPPRFAGKPKPVLLDQSLEAAVSDGERYVAYPRGLGLKLYDSRRNRFIRPKTKCPPVSGVAAHFLLACDIHTSQGTAILDVRTGTIQPLPDPNGFDAIGRYWLRGREANPYGAADVYFNWHTGARVEVPWGSTGIPGYAPLRDINSPNLDPAPAAGEPHGVYERAGDLELSVSLNKLTTAHLRDVRSGRQRTLHCTGGCGGAELGGGHVSWIAFDNSPGRKTYTVSVYDWKSNRTTRWVVKRALDLESGFSVAATHTRRRVFITVASQAAEGDHGPFPVAYRIYSAKLSSP